MLSDWQYFTTLKEARRAVGNLNNEEKGIGPFEYNEDDYTAGPEEALLSVLRGIRRLRAIRRTSAIQGPQIHKISARSAFGKMTPLITRTPTSPWVRTAFHSGKHNATSWSSAPQKRDCCRT